MELLITVLLLFNNLFILNADVAPQSPYSGPVVCKGTKPILFRKNVDIGSSVMNIDSEDVRKKLYEPYWEQFYQHLKGCQIIVGNLIIPHLHGIPFEKDRIDEALKDLEEVTGYIYVYDVDVDLNFAKLRVIHGNELLDFSYNDNKFKDIPEKFVNLREDDKIGSGFALFVEKFSSEIRMPSLKLISKGRIGFLNSPLSCAFGKQYISLQDYYEDAFDTSTIMVGINSHTKCKAEITCHETCKFCFGTGQQNCQNYNKAGCEAVCRQYGVNRCSGNSISSLGCCYQGCRGGCIEATSHNDEKTSKCVACKGKKYLLWDEKKCVDECDGVIIDGTRICLKGKACPDYMFSHTNGRYCSYSCPAGMEYDPARLYRDEGFADTQFDKYWPDADSCRPCKMRFNKDKLDFEDDCGIGCVVSSNSLSYFSVLNIYPAYNNIFDFEFNLFDQYLKNHYGANKAGFTDRERCRYIYGLLHIDHNSVGYPADRVRLTPYHLKILTFATSLYGNIRIENTESFWFADMFRNLIAIAKPRTGSKHPVSDADVLVQYNSDLRTVDLQRLKKRQGKIYVANNPLYIPPRKNDASAVFGDKSTEVIKDNGLEKTRTEMSITYATGCTKKDTLSYYYRRCLECGDNEYRVFVEDHFQYFALCNKDCPKDHYQPIVYGEKLCLPCYEGCKSVGCRGSTPYECGTELGKIECDRDAYRINDPSIEMCLMKECPVGFFKESSTNICRRCEKACRKGCYTKAAMYSFTTTIGCRGCGIIYVAVDGKLKCMDAGTPPRCNQDDNCDMQDTNPVYEYWSTLSNVEEEEEE